VRVITDRALIAEGLRLLMTASNYTPNHETFQDGFGVQMKADSSDSYVPLFIAAYRQSHRTDRSVTPANIVRITTDSNQGGMTLQCPGFHDWLRKNADPLFAVPSISYGR
jgi:hypothetical protein